VFVIVSEYSRGADFSTVDSSLLQDPALRCRSQLKRIASGGSERAALDCPYKPLTNLCLAKTSYTRKMNDLAQSSIRTFPIRFLP
jgi:hypothetical protein